jgi:hypothetical protein
MAAADREKGGPHMSGTYPRPPLAIYRDEVAELMKGGEPFGVVEDAIDDVVDLNQDQKAALWLFAFSLRGQLEQQRDVRAHLSAVH